MSTRQLLPVILFIFMSGALQLKAEVPVIDDGHVLAFLNSSPHKVPFEKSFKCDQPLEFFSQIGKCQVSCDEVICKEMCGTAMVVPAALQVEDCTADGVQVYSSKGHSWSMTRADYEQASHSVILAFLKNLDLFYEPMVKIKIIKMDNRTDGKLIENGKMYQVPTVEVIFDVYTDENIQTVMVFKIELDMKKTGLEQLMYLRPAHVFGTSNDYVLKRKGFINGIL